MEPKAERQSAESMASTSAVVSGLTLKPRLEHGTGTVRLYIPGTVTLYCIYQEVIPVVQAVFMPSCFIKVSLPGTVYIRYMWLIQVEKRSSKQ